MKSKTRLGLFAGVAISMVAVGLIAASSAQAASTARLYAGKNYSDFTWSTTSQTLKVSAVNYDKTCDNLANGASITVYDSTGAQVYSGAIKSNQGLGCGKHNTVSWSLSATTLGANGRSGTLKMDACGGGPIIWNCYGEKSVYYSLG